MRNVDPDGLGPVDIGGGEQYSNPTLQISFDSASPFHVASVHEAYCGFISSALRQMNKDYFDLDQNLAHLLVVACINDNDLTVASKVGRRNGFLDKLCADLDFKKLQELQGATGAGGITSVQIAAAQRTLANAGFYKGPIDGKIGPQTNRAVAAYQNARGLQRTGSLDRETLAQLTGQF